MSDDIYARLKLALLKRKELPHAAIHKIETIFYSIQTYRNLLTIDTSAVSAADVKTEERILDSVQKTFALSSPAEALAKLEAWCAELEPEEGNSVFSGRIQTDGHGERALDNPSSAFNILSVYRDHYETPSVEITSKSLRIYEYINNGLAVLIVIGCHSFLWPAITSEELYKDSPLLSLALTLVYFLVVFAFPFFRPTNFKKKIIKKIAVFLKKKREGHE